MKRVTILSLLVITLMSCNKTLFVTDTVMTVKDGKVSLKATSNPVPLKDTAANVKVITRGKPTF